jgi:hypothetical protein
MKYFLGNIASSDELTAALRQCYPKLASVDFELARAGGSGRIRRQIQPISSTNRVPGRAVESSTNWFDLYTTSDDTGK